jgi:hypothetical protein
MKEIKNIRDLINDEDLVQYIAEDITDIPEDAEVSYEVWTLGYDSNGVPTDSEMLISEFSDPDAAVECAKQLTLADIIHQAAEEDNGTDLTSEVEYISIEVETVIEDEEDGTMNIGTIYKRDLQIHGEYGDETGIPEDEYSEVVPVTSKDYKLLEDGSLEIDCDILKNFNKNDMVQIWFTDENKEYKSILTYKIISKTTANKFICEFIY